MAGEKLKSARAVAIEVLNRCMWRGHLALVPYRRGDVDGTQGGEGVPRGEGVPPSYRTRPGRPRYSQDGLATRSYAGLFLDRLRHQTEQSQRATDLVFGTLRNRTAVDTVIAAFSGRPVKRIQAGLLNIIRVGTYELIYCPSTEQYAIVNEAVVNAKAAGSARQAGFVNAVLREITRHISNRQVPLAGCDTTRTLFADFSAGCQFDTSFLPDRKISPAEYFSIVFSLPEWLVAGWIDEFGEEATMRICLASNRRPSVYIRPNRLRTSIEALAEKMADAQVGYEIPGDSEMIRIKSPRDVSQLPGFSDGWFTVQDITASGPVRLLDPQPDWTILDLCAAPGTKTTQLAEATGDLPHEITSSTISRGKAKIIATDIDARRLEMVKENTARLGIKSVEVVPYTSVVHEPAVRENQAQFDCVLVDAACSNTGVLAKRIEVRYRIKPEAIKELARRQAELLGTAAGLLKPGGKICYSTCSIQKCENSQVVEKFLEQNKNFILESQQLTLPSAEGFDHDGGYAAILVKRKT
ncbi:MAG: hypothetical protein A2168_01200 [Planctomycetes bacterium RBG_13_50_24]|nr:MAG: hypothetical protein A2168_01200 [Planctomycetes bacterium RBG_13_50_24]